jgi:hypothetical protein
MTDKLDSKLLLALAATVLALTIAAINAPPAGGKSDALKTYLPKRLVTSARQAHTPSVYAWTNFSGLLIRGRFFIPCARARQRFADRRLRVRVMQPLSCPPRRRVGFNRRVRATICRACRTSTACTTANRPRSSPKSSPITNMPACGAYAGPTANCPTWSISPAPKMRPWFSFARTGLSTRAPRRCIGSVPRGPQEARLLSLRGRPVGLWPKAQTQAPEES